MSRAPRGELVPGTRIVAVMARPLVPGAVKTRLARALGDDGALAVYERLLRDTLDSAELVPDAALVLAEAPGAAGGPATCAPTTSAPATSGPAAGDPLAGRHGRWSRLAQRGDGLGERLANSFADLFCKGAEAVVLAGSDSPALPSEYLARALVELSARAEGGADPRADGGAPSAGRLVVGPAADGGYYLIGLDRAAWTAQGPAVSALFETSPMSTSSLLDFTLVAAEALGLHVAQLPLWIDIDEPADLGVFDRLNGVAPPRLTAVGGLREVYLHLTHRCGRTCRHCYDKAAESLLDEMTTDQWRDAIDQCVALGAGSFVFIGGDPLVRHDFVELVDHITGGHGARARFFFNCRVDAELAHRLSRAGRGLLRPLVSIDGPREVNDGLRAPGSHDDVMTSIGNLLSVGLEPVANTVLVRPALPGLTQLARELRGAGLSRLHLILPHQRGFAGTDLVPTGAELLVAVRALLTTAAEIGLTVDNLSGWRRRVGKRNDLCAAGCRDLAIDPAGLVHACVITAGDPAFVAGSLREQPLETIWRTSSSLRLLRAARAHDRAECLACPVADACGGECWVQAHYAARAQGRRAGYAAPFPYCDLLRPILEELTAEAGAAGGRADAGSAAPAAGACGGQSAAGAEDYALFDCI